jgi:YbbR domain-containing protein
MTLLRRLEQAFGRLLGPLMARLPPLLSRNLFAKIVSLAAAASLFVLLRVNTLDQRFFSIPLEFQLPAGYVLASTAPQTVRLTLRGEQELILSLNEAEFAARVDLRSFPEEGEYRAPVEVVTEGRAAVVQQLEVQSDPDATTVRIEQSIQKSVPVQPLLAGDPARGYELSGFTITPSAVEIVGPRSAVSAVEVVVTEDIDLHGRTEDFVARVRIGPVDPLLQLPGGRIAEFRAVVVEQVSQRLLAGQALRLANLAAGLSVASGVQPVDVLVSGPRLIVDELRSDAASIIVDLAEVVGEGVHIVVPSATVPERLTVLDLSPATLELVIVASTQADAR